MPFLRILAPNVESGCYQLSAGISTIGRESSNQIQLLDSEISRQHAEIRSDDGIHFQIADLQSSNGTYVNGTPISAHNLEPGDRLILGNTTLVFENLQDPSVKSTERIDVVLKKEDHDGSEILSHYSYPESLQQSISLDPGRTDHVPSLLKTTKADRSLEVIYQTALTLGRAKDLDEILERILNLVFNWVDADRGCIMLKDTKTTELYAAARQDRKTQRSRSDNTPITISQSIADHVFKNQAGVRTSNARTDQRFEASASIVTRGVREALCVPLQGRYSIVGLLYVDTYTPPNETDHSTALNLRFNDSHLKIATAIGYQAAIAIEDTFYYSTLVESERLAAMGQAVASLSHDIKNILQGIRGGSYLIDAGLKSDQPTAVRRGWQMVERNQERISNLVLDMLSFSKDRIPNLKRQDLNNLAREIHSELENRTTELGIAFNLELEPKPIECEFEFDSLHRAILNLVINAIDAVTDTDEMGIEQNRVCQTSTSHVSAEQDSDHLLASDKLICIRTWTDSITSCCMEIEDNGRGIPSDLQDHLFEFFASSKGARGTGIGLPVSAKIVHEHQGSIEVITPRRGKGTVFRITLPLNRSTLVSGETSPTAG
ncbi:MAG: FHA domain-containing protein [Planctomycetota bacterium]|nr:FHA domain-containing protein [Planctomycetota bacterium]